MRLATMTDYALRLLMYVAQQPERLCTIAEIAQVYGVSEAHLMKITNQLGRQGWLDTVRGKGGGIRLAVAPSEIGIGAVVRGMEPDFYLVNCLTQDVTCALAGSCRLTGIMSGALQQMLDYFDDYTLADLLPPDPAEFPVQPPAPWQPPPAIRVRNARR